MSADLAKTAREVLRVDAAEEEARLALNEQLEAKVRDDAAEIRLGRRLEALEEQTARYYRTSAPALARAYPDSVPMEVVERIAAEVGSPIDLDDNIAMEILVRLRKWKEERDGQ